MGANRFDEELTKIGKPSCQTLQKLAKRISANLFQKPALAYA